MLDLVFIPTKTPRFYDPSLPDFRRPASFEGSKLRVKVSIPEGTADYWRLLDRAREEAEKKYPGALVYALPEFKESRNGQEDAFDISSDARLVQQYVESMSGSRGRKFEGQIISYVLNRLDKIGGSSVLYRPKVEVLGVEAENFLSFRKCKFEFKPGVFLLVGENLDWNGGSNGAGKSNFLQLVRAAWYGSTTKGQSVGSLVHRKFRDKRSFVSIRARVGTDEITVLRQRNPVKTILLMDGIDQSSGNRKSKQRGATEEMIVRKIGMTEQMFDHSILVDQNLIHTTSSFFNGTDKQKKELLDSFLGTERFLEAGKLVKEDLDKCINEYESVKSKLELSKAKEMDLRESIESLEEDSRLEELKGKVRELKRALSFCSREDVSVLSKAYRKACAESGRVRAKYLRRLRECAKLKEQVRHCGDDLAGAVSLSEAGKCPLCRQSVDGSVFRSRILQLSDALKQKESAYRRARKDLKYFDDLQHQWEDKADSLNKRLIEVNESNVRRKSLMKMLVQAREMMDKSPESKLLAKSKRKLVQVRINRRISKAAEVSIIDRMDRMRFSWKVLSRDGLVNYLYGKLCLRLNKAAERYSQLLADGVIGLRFVPYSTRKDGQVVNEFDVQIVNTQGGESRKDQSRGEEQIACLICILALREVGPDCNLLILDEPSEGLEPANAARLAEGIERLSGRFSTILLATHNEHLKARFKSGRGGIIIRKVGRVSSLVMDGMRGEAARVVPQGGDPASL